MIFVDNPKRKLGRMKMCQALAHRRLALNFTSSSILPYSTGRMVTVKNLAAILLVTALGVTFCFLAMVAGFTLAAWIIAHSAWLSVAGLLAFHCFFVGVGEEAAFRLLFMDRLLEQRLKLSAWWSVPISSLIFGAAHMVNGSLGQSVGAGFCGFLFAYIYKRYGLFAVAMLHGTYNWFVYMKLLTPIWRWFF